MDPLLAVIANTPPFSIGANGAITPTSGLLASEISLLTSGVSGGTASIVELSGRSQLLSAAATFEDQLRALQPGTATSGGGQNFGTDLASLAAEVQSFVDAFNGLQNNIANINVTANLLGRSVPGAAGLALALDTQAQAQFPNGNSSLTALSQLGIVFQPPQVPGGGGSLSIDLDTLEAAFTSDAAGAFSLLAQAANTFGNVAGNFVGQAGGQFSVLSALTQTSATDQLLTNSILSSTLFSGSSNLADLLALESLTQSGQANSSATSARQILLAINEFTLVSTLLG